MLAEVETDDISSEFSVEDNEEPIELDTTFTKDAPFPGTVKIIVQSTTFWFVRLPRCIRYACSVHVDEDHSTHATVLFPLPNAGLIKRFYSLLLPSSRQR